MLDGMPEIRFADAPGGRGPARQLVIKISPTNSYHFAIVSQRVTGLWTHYLQGFGTVPCTGENGICLYDHARTSTRWQGWLAVQPVGGGRPGWVCLSDSCVWDCPALVNDKDAILRGRTLSLQRAGKERNSRLVAKLDSCTFDKRKLVAEPDAVKFITTLFGGFRQHRKANLAATGDQPLMDSMAFELGKVMAAGRGER